MEPFKDQSLSYPRCGSYGYDYLLVAAIGIYFFDRNHNITEVIRLSSNHDEAFSSTPMLVFLSIPGLIKNFNRRYDFICPGSCRWDDGISAAYPGKPKEENEEHSLAKVSTTV